jgi:SAM-dependent methyltransferase
MANHIQEMVATDLYDNPDHEGNPVMLTHPEAFAPFPYRENHLVVKRMDATQIDYPNETFDFCFTLSSIEHFGSRENSRMAMEEMRRVVKRGGIICVATELILNDSTHHEYFTLKELQETIINVDGLNLVGGELDLRISRSIVENPIRLDFEKDLHVSPHIVMQHGENVWTSVILFFQKSH